MVDDFERRCADCGWQDMEATVDDYAVDCQRCGGSMVWHDLREAKSNKGEHEVLHKLPDGVTDDDIGRS